MIDIKIIVAIFGIAWAVGSFIFNKRKELAWKKAEFICTQCKYFDDDKILYEMTQILENRHPHINIGCLYSNTNELNESEKKVYLQKFDKLLNFLWRFCYLHTDLKVLNKKQITCIGWYLRRISEYPALMEYCRKNGYSRIVLTISNLELA